MNLEQLQKQHLKPVKLRQSAYFQHQTGNWMPVDWVWHIMRIDKKEGRVELHSHHYCLTLMSDHIREFMRSSDREFEGFLILKVAVLIHGDKITIEPLITASA